LLFLVLLLCAAQGKGQARTITYRWSDQSCPQPLSCTGVTACNMQDEADAIFQSTGISFPGLTVCPQGTTAGDNELRLDGWSWSPDTARKVVLEGVALIPMRIDSVLVHYRSGEVDGPRRVVVSFRDLSDGGGEVRDVMSSALPCSTTLLSAGVLDVPSGAGFGSFRLTIQAYEGNGGFWALDEVRIVATSLDQGEPTGISEQATGMSNEQAATTFDLLGRASMAPNGGPRIRTGNIIIVQ
jgi:hypothetical protein